MTDELMSKRITVVLPDDLGEILEEMAKEERRSHSQMGAILIEEAIAAREGRRKKTPLSAESTEKKGGKQPK